MGLRLTRPPRGARVGWRATLWVASIAVALASCSVGRSQGGDPVTQGTPTDAAEREVAGRFYERTAAGDLVERAVPSRVPPPGDVAPVHPVTDARVADSLRGADAAREASLADVASAPRAARLVPEDLTRRARAYHVGVEHFTDAALAEFVAGVGALEGFRVIARLAPGAEWTALMAPVPNLTPIELPGVQYIWTEDITEIGIDGSFRMTARMGDRGLLLRRALFVDRVRRYYPEVSPAELDALEHLPVGPASRPGVLPDSVMRRFPSIMYMNQGLVEADGAQAVAAAIALARGAPLHEAMLYLEGGNVLLGTLPSGEPYALVGRDSAAIARAVLAYHHARPVSEEDAVTAMAKDLGVDRAHVFVVEQPGVFHLDMAMTLLRPGMVVLNDAREALRLQTRWLRDDHEAWRPQRLAAASQDDYREALRLWQDAGHDVQETIERLQKYAERFAGYEARTLADLEAAGLSVVRVPGRFLHPTRPWDRDIMNFVNGESGVNPRGRTYFITQGGDPRAERLMAERLLSPAIGLDRLYVAPRLVSRDTLWEKGGIGCRVKAEGEVVAARPGRTP